MLLRNMPEPSTTEGRRIRDELKGLLEAATVQRAESSASTRRGRTLERSHDPTPQEREASVHSRPPSEPRRAVPIRERLDDNREPRDAREDIDDSRRRRSQGGEELGYSVHRGGRFDPHEDRRRSPEPPGPWVFSREIHRAALPARFRAPTTIPKYGGETKPELWLADFHLACQLGGATDDCVIIRQLPLFLSDSARGWLEELPSGKIQDWTDLV